jgi:RimJ/RimL family protein N-acetyltransferase
MPHARSAPAAGGVTRCDAALPPPALLRDADGMQLSGWAPVLTDGTVILRAHRPDDVEDILEQCRDPLMKRWTRVPSPYEREHAELFVAERQPCWLNREEFSFAVETGARCCGSVGLRPRGEGAAEVGYALAPWARGRGVASRALRLLLEWAFGPLELDTVIWRAEVGNWASRRVAWSAGIRVLGAVPGLLDHRGRSVDCWIGWVRRGDPLGPARPWFVPEVLHGSHESAGAEVVLRPHHDGDADVARMVEACTDAETVRWLASLPAPYGSHDAHRHLADLRAEQAGGEAVYWVVADPVDDRFLAEIAVFRLGGGFRSGEIGYLAHPDARGRGVVTAAVRLVARHALLPTEEGGLGLARVQLLASDLNSASVRVAQKAGLRRSGADRAAELLRDGTVTDNLRFDLLADELADEPGGQVRP